MITSLINELREDGVKIVTYVTDKYPLSFDVLGNYQSTYYIIHVVDTEYRVYIRDFWGADNDGCIF